MPIPPATHYLPALVLTTPVLHVEPGRQTHARVTGQRRRRLKRAVRQATLHRAITAVAVRKRTVGSRRGTLRLRPANLIGLRLIGRCSPLQPPYVL